MEALLEKSGSPRGTNKYKEKVNKLEEERH